MREPSEGSVGRRQGLVDVGSVEVMDGWTYDTTRSTILNVYDTR